MDKNKLIKFLRVYIKILNSFRFNPKMLKKNRIDANIWRRKFINLLKSKDARCEELLAEFFTCQMNRVTHNKIKRKNKYTPILFCVIRNDIYKIKVFMEHYRNLGIEVFVFLDNNSDDGTDKFLKQQKDVILYTSDQQYSSVRRVAWLNRLLAIYGRNRWCLIVDSDELVTYIGFEKYRISDMVRKVERNGFRRVEGFMLDMYPNGELFGSDDGDSYIYGYRYFDTLSYEIKATEREVIISGGPRKRVFDTDILLSKYPLFYFSDDVFVASSHYMIPYEPIRKCPIWIGLCHYKFLGDADFLKIKEAVCNENYAGRSILYKKYLSSIEENNKINFYEEGNSCEMTSSDSLKKISFLKEPFLNKD